MWWNIIPTVVKTGAEIYKNHKQSELLESEAERRYYERMARGEIEYQRDVYDNNDEQLIPQKVTAVSANTVQVDFATPTSGNAIITTGGPRSTSIFNQTGSFYNTNYNIGITGSLVVSGDVDAANFNTTSDKKLKTNLEKIEGALDKIEKLNGYTFNWLESYNDDKTRQIGLLANEVHEVQPELTTQRDILLNGEEQRILLLDYSKLTALLIEGIKELNKEVKELKSKKKKK